MTRNLLVGIAEVSEVSPPRQFLVDLVTDLRTLDVATQVATFADGPVVRALAEVAEVHALRPLRRRSPGAVAQGGVRRISPALAERVQDLRTWTGRRRLRPPDCIHLHGALAMPLLRYVRSPVPVTVYVHPWDFSIAGLAPRDRRELIARTDRFLVADDSVVGPLLDAGVDPDRIVAAPQAVPTLPDLPPSAAARRRARADRGLPTDRPVVAVLPVPDWAAMPDLTLALAWEVERRRPAEAPEVVWFGVPHEGDGDRRWPIDHEVAHMGLSRLRLDATTPAWDDQVRLADAVVLPTEGPDPLPEGFAEDAVRLATPLLCWDDHPRADDVARWGGTVVERGDVVAMADRIVEAFGSPDDLRRVRYSSWSLLTAEIEHLVPVGVPVP
jgi:hypothetical protein